MSLRNILNAVVIAALVPIAAQADPLTYNVNRTIGAGSVFGTITTDGKFGQLLEANIIGWSLTINAGTGPVILDTSNSFDRVDGNALSADADSIDFNFSATGDNLLLIADNLNPNNFWCVETNLCAEPLGAGARETVTTGVSTISVSKTTTETIATRGTNNVPEPTTLVLAGLALFGLAVTRLRRT